MNAPLQLAFTVAWLVNLSINCSGQIPSDTNKLTEISVEQARELIAKATKKSPLRLDGLTTLSPEVASELAKHDGGLFLNGLKTLSPEVASELAKHKGELLLLNGLTTLTAEIATILVKHEEHSGQILGLNGLKALTLEVATILAQHKGRLSLRGVSPVTPDLVAALEAHGGSFFLSGPLSSLGPDGKPGGPVMFVKASVSKGVVRKETDSVTLKIDGVPQLFFRDPNSKEFNTPGPRMAAGAEFGKRYVPTCWSFSPDGQLVAIGSGFRARVGDLDVCEGLLQVWDVRNSKLLMSSGSALSSKLGRVTKVAFSEDGKSLFFESDVFLDDQR